MRIGNEVHAFFYYYEGTITYRNHDKFTDCSVYNNKGADLQDGAKLIFPSENLHGLAIS